MIDSHCHLVDDAFAADRDEAVERARAAGVDGIVVVAESVASSEAARALCAGRSGLWPTAGLHPHRGIDFNDESAMALARLQGLADVVAVGETGLDYHYDHSPRERQRASFEWHLSQSAVTGKPCIVHAREADEDVARMIADAPAGASGVLHSFSGGRELLLAALERGFAVSFSGMVTFAKYDQQWAVEMVPDDRLLIETDAPFLAPAPNRGRRNEPSYLPRTAARVAEIRGASVERIAELTRNNAIALFRLSHAPLPTSHFPGGA